MTPMQRAKEVYDRYEASYNRAGVLEGSYNLSLEDLIAEEIAKASAEERSRCADIADRFFREPQGLDEQQVAEIIRNLIIKPETNT